MCTCREGLSRSSVLRWHSEGSVTVMCLLVRTSERLKGVIVRALVITYVLEIFFFFYAVYVWAMWVSRPGHSAVRVMGCKALFGRNKGILKQRRQGKRRCKDRSQRLVTHSIAFSTDISSPYDVSQFLGWSSWLSAWSHAAEQRQVQPSVLPALWWCVSVGLLSSTRTRQCFAELLGRMQSTNLCRGAKTSLGSIFFTQPKGVR